MPAKNNNKNVKDFIKSWKLYSEREALLSVTKERLGYLSAIDVLDDTRTSRVAEPDALMPLLKYLEEAFAHFCASPDRDVLYDVAYAFPDSDDLKKDWGPQWLQYRALFDRDGKFKCSFFKSTISRGGKYINASQESVVCFVDFLCELTNKDVRGVSAANYEKVLYLVGNIGEGKTSIINYILSKFMDKFEEENVIPVRIDFADVELSGVREFVVRQSIEYLTILCQHYFYGKGNSKPRVSLEDFINFLHTHSASTELVSKVRNFVASGLGNENRRCCAVETAFPNSDDIVFFAQQLQGYLSTHADRKYKTLCIIDGLDNYNRETVPSIQAIFRDRVSQVATYLHSKDALNIGSNLVVMREESFRYISTEHIEGAGPHNKCIDVYLFHVPFKKIIESKFSLLKMFLGGAVDISSLKRLIAREVDGSASNEIQKLFNRIVPLVDAFKALLVRMINMSFFRKSVYDPDVVRMIYDTNNRTITDGIVNVATGILYRIELFAKAECPHDPISYLEDLLYNSTRTNNFIRKYHYIIQYSLMMNKRLYCYPRFAYYTEENYPGVFTKVSDFHHTGTLIQNIFICCTPETGLNVAALPQNIFCRVRILQYLIFAREGRNSDKININDLCGSMSTLFSYPVDLIMAEIQMLYEEQCLFIYFNRIYPSSRVIITRLGETFIRNLIYSFEYLANAVDSAVVERDFCKKFLCPPESLAFEGNDYQSSDRDSVYNQRSGFSSLLVGKIVRVMSFVSYCKVVESIEESCFIEKIGIEGKIIWNSNWNISKKMESSVSSTLNKILSSDSEFMIDHVIPGFIRAVRNKVGDDYE